MCCKKQYGLYGWMLFLIIVCISCTKRNRSAVEVTVVDATTNKPVSGIPVSLRRFRKLAIRGSPSEYIDTRVSDVNGQVSFDFKYDRGNNYRIESDIGRLYSFSPAHTDATSYFLEDKQNLELEKDKTEITLKVYEQTFLKLRLTSNQARNKAVHISDMTNFSFRNVLSLAAVDTVVLLKISKYGHDNLSWKVHSGNGPEQTFTEPLYYNGHDTTYYTINY